MHVIILRRPALLSSISCFCSCFCRDSNRPVFGHQGSSCSPARSSPWRGPWPWLCTCWRYRWFDTCRNTCRGISWTPDRTSPYPSCKYRSKYRGGRSTSSSQWAEGIPGSPANIRFCYKHRSVIDLFLVSYIFLLIYFLPPTWMPREPHPSLTGWWFQSAFGVDPENDFWTMRHSIVTSNHDAPCQHLCTHDEQTTNFYFLSP